MQRLLSGLCVAARKEGGDARARLGRTAKRRDAPRLALELGFERRFGTVEQQVPGRPQPCGRRRRDGREAA